MSLQINFTNLYLMGANKMRRKTTLSGEVRKKHRPKIKQIINSTFLLVNTVDYGNNRKRCNKAIAHNPFTNSIISTRELLTKPIAVSI